MDLMTKKEQLLTSLKLVQESEVLTDENERTESELYWHGLIAYIHGCRCDEELEVALRFIVPKAYMTLIHREPRMGNHPQRGPDVGREGFRDGRLVGGVLQPALTQAPRTPQETPVGVFYGGFSCAGGGYRGAGR